MTWRTTGLCGAVWVMGLICSTAVSAKAPPRWGGPVPAASTVAPAFSSSTPPPAAAPVLLQAFSPDSIDRLSQDLRTSTISAQVLTQDLTVQGVNAFGRYAAYALAVQKSLPQYRDLPPISRHEQLNALLTEVQSVHGEVIALGDRTQSAIDLTAAHWQQLDATVPSALDWCQTETVSACVRLAETVRPWLAWRQPVAEDLKALGQARIQAEQAFLDAEQQIILANQL